MYTAALLTRLSSLPGVRHAAAASAVPFKGGLRAFGVRNLVAADGETVFAERQFVTEDYFSALGVPIVRGRTFRREDRQSAPVAVVSESLDRQFFNGQSLGQSFGPYRVIGVAGDVRYTGATDRPRHIA